jgi:hypothetical protein
MGRFLLHLAVFLLPFVLYGLWLARRRHAGGAPDWRDGPWYWLAASGLGLVLVVTTVFIVADGDRAGGTYVPARFEDGKVVPGETR